jgi:signal transduction histidine kinase
MFQMPRAAGIPIRYKILLGVLMVVTAVVSTITFTMAQMFHADKKIYVRDLSAVQATHAAQETQAVIASYRDRLDVCARLLEEPKLSPGQRTALVQDVLEGFQGFVALTAYSGGTVLASVYNDAALTEAGVRATDLQQYREQHPLPFARILAGQTFVENSTVGGRLPTLTIAIAHARGESSPLVLSAVLRLDDLMTVATRSRAFNVYIVDGRHTLLSDRDPAAVMHRTHVANVPRVGANSAALVREFADRGEEKIAGYAPVEGTDLIAAAEVPRATAYFASRQLLRNLFLVALLLLAAAAVVSMIWSQSLTRSIARLVEATREIGQGRYDVDVKVRSRDEIGTLAESFHQMAHELHARETALKDAEGQLIQSEKMAAFGQLGAGVAHEVKNPLAGILGLVQLLRRKTYADSDLNEGLATMEKETKRCRSIIDNLLRFARQERLGFAPVDVRPIVIDAVSIMKHQLELNQVTLEIQVPDVLPSVRGNANQLQQVIMNLVLNAQQAMSGRRGEVTVEAHAGREGQLVIRVRDNGPGIPREIQSRIFEPFFTTKPSGHGTGLGLSVSYGIVQEHHGTITVESEPGNGTMFVIELPTVSDAEAAAASLPFDSTGRPKAA